MFANKGLFDGEGEVDMDAHAADYQNARPVSSSQQDSSVRFHAGGAPASTPPGLDCASTISAASSSSSSGYASQQRPAGIDRAFTYDRQQSSNMAASLGGGRENFEDLPVTSPTPAMRRAKMEEQRRAQLDKRKQKALAAPAVLRANADQLKSTPPVAASAALSSPHSAAAASSGNALSPKSSTGAASADALSPKDSDDENDGVAPDHLDSNMSSMLAQKRAEQSRKAMSQAERDMLQKGIAPVFDPSGDKAVLAAGPAVKPDYSDMRSFLMSPVPKGAVFQCYILRNKKGLKNKLYPTYEVYVSGEERFLLAAKKRTKNKTSNYMISMEKGALEEGADKESAGYMGKVRSNFVGTEFVGYDRGLNPSELSEDNPSVTLLSVRQELCAVFYESNILGSKGPRKMTAVIPAVKRDGTRAVWRPLGTDQSVAVAYRRSPNHADFLTLVNKTPKWNDVASAYVLNFNGRVTQASVKNFQLINLEDPETVLLQFGRIGKDTFTMDMQYPVSPMQAFQIALTSFDYKFACE